MKKLIIILISVLLIVVLATSFIACNKQNNSDVPQEDTPADHPDSGEHGDESDRTPAEISESAMNNFLNKVQNGNYTIETKDYLTISVHSQNLIIIDYADKTDFAYMTASGDTFRGVLTEDGVTDIEYIINSNALVAAKDRLLACWIDIADGNIWNVFYNNLQKPLEFSSNDLNIKNSLMNFAQVGPMVIGSMQNVLLVLDAENPTVAHIKASFEEGSGAQDIDIKVTFGSSFSDARAESWMNNPVYPEIREAWTSSDIFAFNSIFLAGYGEKAVPFVEGGSYAMTVTFEVAAEKAEVRDVHATEKVYNDYLAILQSKGFVKDEETGAYRLLLREEYNAYSSLSVTYGDNGLYILAKRYYDNPHYEGLTDVNAVLEAHGFDELATNEKIATITAVDGCKQRNEGLWYFFNYDLDFDILVEFDGAEAIEEYVEAYIGVLESKGFEAYYIDDALDRYGTANSSKLFRYRVEGSALRLLFRSEKFVTAEEVKERVEGAGFPEIDLSAYFSARDITKYRTFMDAANDANFLTLTLLFESAEDAETWLEGYITAKIIDELALLPINPRSVGSQKQNGYGDEEMGIAICFDYDSNSAMVYIDFTYPMVD